MPDRPDPELYEVIEDGHGAWAVVLAGTNTPVEIDGVPQVGLDIQDADDLSDSLAALARITAGRSTRTVQ